MNNILLDTSILVDYFRYNKTTTRKSEKRIYNATAGHEFIINAVKRKDALFISVITLKELLQYKHISPQEEDRILVAMPKVCQILPITFKIAVMAGKISRQSTEYRDSHIEDCYIAATAIVHKIPIYTRNPKDFRYFNHPNLRIEEPYQYQPY